MGKALKTAGAIIGGAVLMATGVGALAGVQVTAMGIAGIGTMSVANLQLMSAGLMAAGSMLDKPKSTASGSPSDWTSNPDQGIPFLFGRMGVAGKIVHRDEYGQDNRLQGIVTIYSGAGPVKSFQGFTADELPVSFVSNGGTAVGKYNRQMWRSWRLGEQPDTALSLPTGLDGGAVMPMWGAAYKLSGKACDLLTLQQDSKFSVYPSGEPKPMQVLEGVYGYDPRYDDTYPGGAGPCRYGVRSTYRYIDNAIIAALNWALGMIENGQVVGGIGASLQGVDLPAFVEAANIADANAWTVAAWPDTSEDASVVLDELLEAGGAKRSRVAGKISCVSRGAPRPSIVTITRRDTAGAIELDTGASRFNRLNTITPVIMSEAHKWQHAPMNPVSFAPLVAEDGGKRSDQIKYRFVPKVKQGAELAAYDILDAREPFAGTIPLLPHLRRLKPGDCFDIDEPGFMLDGVKMLVLGRAYDPKAGEVRIAFRSETDSKHPLALGKTTTMPAYPGLTAPDPTEVSPPQPGDWTIIPRPPAPGGQLPVIDLSGIVSNATADAMLINWREVVEGEDPTAQPPFMDEEGELLPGWVDAGVWPPTTRTLSIQGPQPGAQIWIAIRYKRGNNVSPAELAGPITVGDLIAGDIIPTAPTIVGIRNDIEAAFGDIFDVSELVGQTRQAVEALEEVYGDTASAATSAAAAAASEAAAVQAKADAIIAKGEAQDARDEAAQKALDAAGSAAAADDARAAAIIAKGEAQGAAGSAAADALVAAQKAGEALGSANSAAGSAATATTKAGEAGTAAAAALASSVTATTAKDVARNAASAVYPADFSQDGRFFTFGPQGDPATATEFSAAASPSRNIVFKNVAGVGRVLQESGSVLRHLRSRNLRPAIPGARYRIRARVRWTTLPSSGTASLSLQRYGLQADFTTIKYGPANDGGSLPGSVSTVSSGAKPVGTWTDLGFDHVIAANPDYAWFAPTLYASHSSGDLGVYEVQFLSNDDVTAQVAAENSAKASALSASNASASQTAAGQSASAADTSRQQAQTARAGAEAAQSSAADSATTATGAAATATQQAGLATTAKNASEAAAAASVDARDQAASFADDAEVSANASSAASVTAVAARQAAEAAQGGSEDARDQSQSAATAAAGSASTAATKATEAGNSATAANAAKVAAESARDTADQKATAAAQSASSAATSSTQAGQSASAAQTAKTDAETARAQAQTSASNASNAATNAAGSAATASSAAGQSVTAKDQAQGFANAANTSAQNAAGSATAAGNSASAANTSKTAAEAAYGASLAAAIAGFPDVIAADLLAQAQSGAPNSRPRIPAAQVVNGVYTPPVGAVGTAYFGQYVPWEVGKVYEVVAEIEGVSAASGVPHAVIYGNLNDAAYARLVDRSSGAWVPTPVGQTTRLAYRIGLGVLPPTKAGFVSTNWTGATGAAWVNLGPLFNRASGGGAQAGAQSRLTKLTIRDVTAVVAAEQAADKAVITGGNQGFEDGLTGWGPGLAAPGTTNLFTDANRPDWQSSYQGRTGVVVSRPGMKRRDTISMRTYTIDTSRKYRIRTSVYVGAGGTARTYVGMRCFDAAGVSVGGNSGLQYSAIAGTVLAENSGWTDRTSGILTGEGTAAGNFNPGTKQIQLLAFLNFDNTTGTETALDGIWIEDVTESENAKASATASATSAASAAASATLAGEKASAAQASATAADTSRGQAQTAASQASQSETNAAGSAASASSAAQNAATSRDQASGFATAASGSASTASTKATEAGNSAAAAAASQVSASAAKDAAVSAKDGAETARGQAQSSATAAAASASSAAASATTAGEKATAASGSAVTAATKAGEALSYAYDAATSAANAQGAAESIATSIEGLEARTAHTEADIIDLENALANETMARAEAVGQLTARSTHKPNLIDNPSGAGAFRGWSKEGSPASYVDDDRLAGRIFVVYGYMVSQVYPAAPGDQHSLGFMASPVGDGGHVRLQYVTPGGLVEGVYVDAGGGAIDERRRSSAPSTAPAGTTGFRLVVAAPAGGLLPVWGIKVNFGSVAADFSDDYSATVLAATVTDQSLAIVDLENQQLLAAWQKVADASGGKPARIGLVSSTLGSYVALDAPYIFWGDNTVFEDATDTLQTTVGENRKVLAFGAPFGASGNLLEWWGPATTALGTMTTGNGLNGRMTTAPYVFDNVIGGGKTGGARSFSSGPGGSSAQSTVPGVLAGSMLEATGAINGGSLDADAPLFGTISLYEESGGVQTLVYSEPVTVTSDGLQQPNGSYEAQGASIISPRKFATKSGAVTYSVTFSRTGGSSFVNGAVLSATFIITPPA